MALVNHRIFKGPWVSWLSFLGDGTNSLKARLVTSRTDCYKVSQAPLWLWHTNAPPHVTTLFSVFPPWHEHVPLPDAAIPSWIFHSTYCCSWAILAQERGMSSLWIWRFYWGRNLARKSRHPTIRGSIGKLCPYKFPTRARHLWFISLSRKPRVVSKTP